MTTTILFWLLFILWILFGTWLGWPRGEAPQNARFSAGNTILLFLLLFLLGWRVFGFPIHD